MLLFCERQIQNCFGQCLTSSHLSIFFPFLDFSVRTDLMEIGANSTLLVAKVNTTDAGNYTCSIGESQQYTVLVHVLNGKMQFAC